MILPVTSIRNRASDIDSMTRSKSSRVSSISAIRRSTLQFALGAREITVGHVETTEHIWPGSLVQRGVVLLLT